jgi:hypothetical protein
MLSEAMAGELRTADGKEGWVLNTGQLTDIDESHQHASNTGSGTTKAQPIRAD